MAMNSRKTLKYNGWTDDIVFCQPDIVYSERGGRKLKLHLVMPMDIHYAKKNGYNIDRTFPLVVYAKGSAFTHPEYSEAIGRACRIAEHGFIVAMIEYSNILEGNTILDTCIDYKTAIRYLRAHAGEYYINADKVAAWGTSSGGTDALFAALTGDFPKYKTAEYYEFSDSVDVVVDINGPSELRQIFFSDTPLAKFFRSQWETNGTPKDPKQQCDEASPLFFVDDRKLPPMMIVHGTEDPIVPFSQSEKLFQKLTEKKQEATFFAVEGAGHGSAFTSEVLEAGVEFIRKHL